MNQEWYISEVYTTLARDARLDGLSVENSVGVALPGAVGFIFCKLGEWLPGVPLQFFTRNEFGIANGAILEAVVNGASVIYTVMQTRPHSPPPWLAKSSRAINIEHLKAEKY